MRSFGAMLTRRLAADQRISYKKMHLFGGICKNPHTTVHRSLALAQNLRSSREGRVSVSVSEQNPE